MNSLLTKMRATSTHPAGRLGSMGSNATLPDY
jgi:hypothetical protein